MSNLSNTIYTYFLAHFDELPLDKQLHFATRLYLWRNDSACSNLVEELRGSILPSGNVTDSLLSIAGGELLPTRPGSQNVLHIRQPYFDKYPSLRRSAMILYWANLLDNCFGTTALKHIDDVVNPEELALLNEQLLSDRPAVAILSTYAINFLYLYNNYYLGKEMLPDPSLFATIADDSSLYDFNNPLQTQLRIYLLTHSVIAESLFYSRAIAPQKLVAYRRIVQQLEAILDDSLGSINLDNKFEFLVCCRLVGYKSRLEQLILDEAADSLAPNSTFLIDTHNTNKQSGYISLDKSEHRNVLYLMATTDTDRILPIAQSESK